jgi:DNA-binding MarR family transcriptional regulator
MTDTHDMPGHLARRFQQIAVAVFLAEVEAAGYDLTPVQYAALAAIGTNHGVDQVTLAGLIAYDRTTITGVVDRLVQKGLVARQESSRDRRARELKITEAGRRTLRGLTPVVEAAQRIMLRGLTDKEAKEFMRLLQKATAAGNELSRAPLRIVASGCTPLRFIATSHHTGARRRFPHMTCADAVRYPAMAPSNGTGARSTRCRLLLPSRATVNISIPRI